MSNLNTEMKDVMSKGHVLFDVAEKVENRLDLNAEEKEIAEISDRWCKEIGESGKDPDCEIAAYRTKYIMDQMNYWIEFLFVETSVNLTM